MPRGHSWKLVTIVNLSELKKNVYLRTTGRDTVIDTDRERADDCQVITHECNQKVGWIHTSVIDRLTRGVTDLFHE